MIQKDRLSKLIEEKATIYEAKYNNINPVYLGNPIRNISYKYGFISFEPRFEEKYKSHKYLKNLFETKEEAEWQNKIPTKRVEKFEPLYYDNIDQNYCYDYRFTSENKHEYLIRISGKDLILFWVDCDYKEYYKNTKENYEKLIEKCRKIFLGGDNGTTRI